MSDEKFEVGDEVEAFGLRGKVTRYHPPEGGIALVQVVFKGHVHRFELDGRAEPWHKTPSLKLIAKKKKPFRWEGETYVDTVCGYCQRNYFTTIPNEIMHKAGKLTFVEIVEGEE